MNEFVYQLGVYLYREDDALELALRLADTPMSAVGSKSLYGLPSDTGRELLLAEMSGASKRH